MFRSKGLLIIAAMMIASPALAEQQPGGFLKSHPFSRSQAFGAKFGAKLGGGSVGASAAHHQRRFGGKRLAGLDITPMARAIGSPRG